MRRRRRKDDADIDIFGVLDTVERLFYGIIGGSVWLAIMLGALAIMGKVYVYIESTACSSPAWTWLCNLPCPHEETQTVTTR